MPAKTETKARGVWGGWLRLYWAASGLACLAPLAGMAVSREWRWTASDFIVLGATLAGTGAGLEYLLRAGGDRAFAGGLLLAVGAGAMLAFAELAVGVYGDGGFPASLMVWGSLLAGGLGLFRFRRQPRMLAGASLLLAAATPAGAMIADLAGETVTWPAMAVFTGLWLAAAVLLFRSRGPGAGDAGRGARS